MYWEISAGLGRESTAARLLGLWVETRRVHGRLSLVIVVYCQVQASASGWSLVLRIPTECGVSNECDSEAPQQTLTVIRVEAPQERQMINHYRPQKTKSQLDLCITETSNDSTLRQLTINTYLKYRQQTCQTINADN
jgi:hypothetical protein